MIKKIEIEYQNQCITLDNEKRHIKMTQDIKPLKESDIDNLIRIMRYWETTYPSTNKIDGIKYKILIITDKEEVLYSSNELPTNFYQFQEYIGELYER